ncbi:MAG: hypothetical protein ABIJ97_06675 [Bacteroidota bacterium]
MNILCLIIIISTISSCNYFEKEEIEISESELLDADINENKKIAELLNSFSINWTQLTCTDTGYIVYHPCDAENNTIIIEKKENNYFLSYNWGQESTVHKINSIDKKAKNKYVITAEFGNESFEFIISFLDKDKTRATWEWSWKDAFDGTKKYFQKVFTPTNHLSEYSEYKQPCIECWEPANCIDFIAEFEKRKTYELFENIHFKSRIDETFLHPYPDLLKYFDQQKIIQKTDDQFFIFESKQDTASSFDEAIMVIDLDLNAITISFAKDNKCLLTMSEVEEKLYPNTITNWISERK